MATDVAETRNVEAQQPAVVARLTTLLERYVEAGRSTPGMPQRNDVPVNIYKQDADGTQGGERRRRLSAPNPVSSFGRAR